jgi:iron complex outermembrane receptor protein
MTQRILALMASTCLASLAMAPTAWAQSAGSDDAANEADDEASIIVTGTFIRGVAPAGTPTIGVTRQDIAEAGGNTVQDVLAKIPQLSFFNRQPTSGNDMGVGQRLPPQQPQIHGLPTLILLDGHRIAAAGAGGGGAATSVDPSIIPTGVLGGIEIVPDGGSATYGSDAVGGVINMTTLKKFDGVRVDGTVSIADDYVAWRGNITGGKDWQTGSAYVSYSYTKSDGLIGADRPYIEQVPLIVTCSPSTVTANAAGAATAVQYTYTAVGADGKPTGYVTGPNRCSRYGTESIMPSQEMHSVFAGLSQEIASWLEFDLRGFYSTRRSKSVNAFALVGNTTNFPSTNPFYLATPAQVGTTRTQRVDFTLAPAVGPNLPTTTNYDTWAISGEFKANLFSDFQARLLGNYSESKFASFAYESLNTALLAQALARTDPATALNPYAPASTPGSALAAQQIANRPTTAQGLVKQTQVRLVTDGTLLTIPGGNVKIAFGGEVLRETFSAFSRTVDFAGSLTSPEQRFSGPRTVASAFGELEIPLISPESNGPVNELRLSIAGRYDHYSDFGDTFNPRFAVSLKPTEWLTFRGTYGKSFIAPALPQLYSPLTTTQSNTAFILPPGASNILIVTGGNPSLLPQKATTWSLGMDLKAPFAEGLRASLTYYNARFRDKLASGPFTSVATFYTPTYASFYIQNPNLQQVLAFIGGPTAFTGLAGNPTLASLFAADGSRLPTSPAYISSGRTGNLSREKNEGLDFDLDYQHPTSFGSLQFGLGGNYVLNRKNAADGVVFIDSLLTETRFRGTVTLGANVDNFRITATLFHTAGYGLPVNATTQTRVNDYNTVDTYMSYTFKSQGFLEDAVVSVQVTNLLNVRPPVNLIASSGYAPGNILGRTFQLGINKKF